MATLHPEHAYEPESEIEVRHHFDDDLDGWRHGFVNLLMASVACDDGADPDTVGAIIAETDPEAFSVTAAAARWRDIHLPGSAIRRSRRNGFIAFGSSDIDGPIEDLDDLGFLGDGCGQHRGHPGRDPCIP